MYTTNKGQGIDEEVSATSLENSTEIRLEILAKGVQVNLAVSCLPFNEYHREKLQGPR